MKMASTIILHVINICFLIILGITTVASFSNPSADSISPFNPIKLGSLTFLFLFWGANYIFQIINKNKWWIILLGSVLFIGVYSFVVLLVVPKLYAIFYY
ncbi:MAG: hypothetical protein ACI4XL_01500 [Bacillus sp. (in: firmicutes)]